MCNHESIYVKKLGGENAAELYQSTLNIIDDAKRKQKQIIVVSAMRSEDFNTTDVLIQIGDILEQGSKNTPEILILLTSIYEFHRNLIDVKLQERGIDMEQIYRILDEAFSYVKESLSKEFIGNTSEISKENDYSFMGKNGETISLLGFGEKLSSLIFTGIMNQASQNSETYESVYAGNICDEDKLQNCNQSETFEIISRKLTDQLRSITNAGNIPIVSGYLGALDSGIEQNIGRGYTDATAAMIAVGMAYFGYEAILEIQKSVIGVLSADPRILYKPDSARLITELDYITAREITGDSGANAKLLHSQAIRAEVQDAGVKIHLYNPFCTEKQNGTWVLPYEDFKAIEREKCIFVGGRKNIVFFSVSSGKMFHAGILAKIFSIVQEYFSVDIISASETEVSFTIDGSQDIQKKLDEMEEELRIACGIPENSQMEFIEYETNKALVFCVGQDMKNHVGFLKQTSNVLSQNDINIEIVSQGRLQRSIVYGINEGDMEKAINVLHEEFIGNIS